VVVVIVVVVVVVVVMRKVIVVVLVVGVGVFIVVASSGDVIPPLHLIFMISWKHALRMFVSFVEGGAKGWLAE